MYSEWTSNSKSTSFCSTKKIRILFHTVVRVIHNIIGLYGIGCMDTTVAMSGMESNMLCKLSSPLTPAALVGDAPPTPAPDWSEHYSWL